MRVEGSGLGFGASDLAHLLLECLEVPDSDKTVGPARRQPHARGVERQTCHLFVFVGAGRGLF